MMALVLVLPFLPLQAKVTKKYYKSTHYQIRSMEDGKWEFHPGEYYVVTHPNYSGGYWTWNLHIKWKESKSDTKRCGPNRLAQIPLEVATVEHLNAQIDSVSPLVVEETVREAERLVDIIYPQYSGEFKELGNEITDALIYIQLKGGERYANVCLELEGEYDALCSEIEYIHKQGPENQMEPTKRELAYDDARLRMKELAKTCSRIVYMVKTEE